MVLSSLATIARASTLIASFALVSACSSDDGPNPQEGDAGSLSAGSGGSGSLGGSGAAGRGGAGGPGGAMSSGGMAGRGGEGVAGVGGKSAAGGSSGKAGNGGVGGEGDQGGRGGRGGDAGSGAGAGGVGGGSGSGEHGFNFRNPDAKQLDWLCTFSQSEPQGFVYVRLDLTGMMQAGIATIPVYTAALAQVSVAGTVSMLDSAAYVYGGGHNNDSLTIEYQGKTYSYYHSSFGFGFRKCQPMDCIDVYELGTTTLETEGCGPDRALPEVCVLIDAGGMHDPLEDTFQKCPGDTG